MITFLNFLTKTMIMINNSKQKQTFNNNYKLENLFIVYGKKSNVPV
jgi:hypothetical protein